MNKKQIIFNAIAFCFGAFGITTGSAQIGIGTGSSIDASAVLEVASTSKGFLPPRMDSTQRNAITSAANGLIIYNTDLKKLQVRENNVWSELVSKRANEIGQDFPTAELSFYDNTSTGPTVVTFPSSGGVNWDGKTTTTTNWVPLSCPTVGTGLGNTQLDSNGLKLGARVNSNIPIIAYPGGKNRTIDISVSGTVGAFSVQATNPTFVIGVFKTSGPSGSRVTRLLPESVFMIPNQKSTIRVCPFRIKVYAEVGDGDSFDLRMAQIGGTYASSWTVPFKSLIFTAIGL